MTKRLDHELTDKFLVYILDRYMSGQLDRGSAAGAIHQLLAALDLPPGEGDDPIGYMRAVLAGVLEH